MNIFYKYTKLALLGILMLGISSCSDDLLDQENPNSLPYGDETIRDITSLTNATNGVYDRFQAIDYYNRTFILLPELMADNVFISRQRVGFYVNYDNLTVTVDDGNAAGAWAAMYQVIGNANLAISGGEALSFQDANVERGAQVIGEMYAARALAHFDLVRLFAQPYNATADASHLGVPVVTAPLTEPTYPERNTVAEVYDQIIADLMTAKSMMNVQKSTNGRFSLGAVNALLSKVYLYMEDWENAETFATEVIESGNYALLPDSQYVSSWSNDFSSESILEIENTIEDRPAVNGIGMWYEQGQYGDALATEDLYNTYSSTDVRRQLIEVGSRGSAENPAYIVHKYPRGLTTQDDNIKVLRLSEVYLIRAEARAEQGKDGLAQADLNQIIQMRDPGATEVTSTGDALVDRILLERRKELAFEGNRLFDLTRKKKDVTLIQSDNSTVLPYDDERLVLPIPQRETNVNPNLEQNENWD